MGGFPVISIVGEGGVGKSALALKVAYELIDKDSPFDAVVWVTSKTTQITLNEIREIKGAISRVAGFPSRRIASPPKRCNRSRMGERSRRHGNMQTGQAGRKLFG